MNEENKIRSFRISDTTADKFRTICGEFPNQNAALESLIASYEIQTARTILTDRQIEISDYSSHIQALQNAFLYALELTENTETRIRTEFQKLLDSKDGTILSLQDTIKESKAKAQAADERATASEATAQAQIAEAENSIQTLQKQLDTATRTVDELSETIKANKDIINDKQQIIFNLQEQLKQARQNSESIPELKSRALNAETALTTTQIKIDNLTRQLEADHTAAEQLAKVAEKIAEAEKKTAIAEIKSKYLEKIEGLTDENSKLKDEIRSLKEKLEKINTEFQKKIEELTTENSKLKDDTKKSKK